MNILISPSILSSDFGKLNEEIHSIESYVDMIHMDIMDGHFVPNITFGAPILAKLRSIKPLDVHLMIESPEKYLEDFAKAIDKAHGSRNDCFITIHAEACPNLSHTLRQITELGCRASVSIKPATSLDTIKSALNELDMVLLMTVNPGFGGQEFMESVLPKIRELRKLAPTLNIEVDGGINNETAKLVIEAGANVLVSGSFIFGSKDRIAAIKSLKK